MEESERGRLYPKKADGSEMAPFIIKKRVLYIGSGDSCGIRMYTDGIYPEHCALTTGKKGRVYFEPLHPTALALVNQDKITKKCLLKQDDVITILVKSFRFAYPANTVHNQISVKTPILPTMAVKTITPKRRISSARKSASPKGKSLPNVDDNLHILRVKKPSAGIGAEQNIQKKKKLSICDKRVRFGPRLTPEEFDKHLPPSSPLRRGSLPGETHSQSIMKQRLSFQLSPNVLKRKKVSVNAKRLSSGSKRNSFPLQSAKMSRGSPLVDKSLNIANESSSTFTVNAEVHSGQKSKIETPIESMPSHKRSSSFSFIESEDLGGMSPYSVPMDSITKVLESSVSKSTPIKFNKYPSNLNVRQDVFDTICSSIPTDDITKISQSPPSKKTSLKSAIPDSFAMDKRPLFSEVLKKQKAHSEKVSTVSEIKSPKSNVCLQKPSKHQVDRQKISEKLVHRQILAVGSTGHANSPDTIILRKRKITEVDDISDVINVRRSPRTPRRAKYGTVTIPLEELPEDNVKPDFNTTPTQPRNSNKLEEEIFKNQDIQLEEMCNIETEKQQHSDNTAVEQVEEKVIEKITTSSRKSKKTQEFVRDALSDLSFGEKAKENDIQLELSSDALFEQFHEEGMKQDIKATPNQLKKGRKSRVEFTQKQDSQLDDLCNIQISEKSNENEDVQLELNSDALFGQFHEEGLDQNIKATPNQQRKGRKSGEEFIQKPDSQLVDLCNIETGGYTEKETDSKFQSCSPKYDEDVKDIKNTGNKQPRRGRKLLQSLIENEDKKLENLIKPENITVEETKKAKQPRKGRKQLQVPQENKNEKLEDLPTQDKYSDNTTDLESPHIDSLFNEKENEESLKLIGKKSTKRSRSKVAKLLNENEENQLKENLNLGESSEITVGLNSGSSNDVSVLRATQETVKTNIKNIKKPLPKRRKVKKDCSSEGDLKSIAHELSSCRRVTRSMAKKCASK